MIVCLLKRTFLNILPLILILCGGVWPQNQVERAEFVQALAAYQDGKYQQASAQLQELVAQVSGNSHITSGYLLLALTQEKLADDHGAERSINLLLRSYPYSRYVDYGHFLLARIANRQGLSEQALDHLLTIIERNKNAELVNLSQSVGTRLVSAGIESEELERLMANHSGEIARPWLTLWMIRCRYGVARRAEAEALAQQFLAENPEPRLVRLVSDMRARPAADLRYPVRIGIIMPVTGYHSAEATAFVRGMAFALQQKPASIELYLADSQEDLNKALTGMQELLQRNVSLYVGELDGTISAALAALASRGHRPILVPLSTDEGISALGQEVFQMNNDLETRGRALARYVYSNLALKSFATLAPADEYGQTVTDAFTQTIDELGGTIVAQQWYYAGAQDFKRQFSAIRASAMKFSPRDSLTVAMYQDSLARARREIAPVLDYAAHPSQQIIDNFEVPIRSIDGIFLPAYEEDIEALAPQLALANIAALPLGGEAWFNPELLTTQKRYINGLVFFSGKFVDETALEFIQFVNKYRGITRSSPTIFTVYGYDLMRLLSAAVDAGNISSADIVRYLEKMKNYIGLGGSYSFSESTHVNQSVNLLQYKDGVIQKLTP